MNENSHNPAPVLTLSESAAGRIKDLFEQNNLSDAALRVFLREDQGQIAHGIAPETNISQQDAVFEQHGLTVVVDQGTVPALQGAHVDYEGDAGDGAGAFTVSNPNLETQ